MIDFLFQSYQDISVFQIVIEIIVFIFGIASVYFAKKENIWVYPTGIIATILTVYLLFEAKYFADMSINIYFSVMSIYGWIVWSKKNEDKTDYQIHISKAGIREKYIGIVLFFVTIAITYSIYKIFDIKLAPENYIDIFTSGLFFTAMWYMARKKIENWTLWIIGDIIVVPLYFYRGLGILALQYIIFTILAILAYREWKTILDANEEEIKN